MNAANHAVTAIFDAFLKPFELVGPEFALIAVSGIFGVIALIAFKHISYQRGIKAAKNKIKAHLIEIRIYQDDLAIVSKAIGKVLLRNFQYLALNFGPFVPLSLPFVFVLAQLVVRYGFAPVPTTLPGAEVLPGRGTMIEVRLDAQHAQMVDGLRFEFPEGVRPLSPLVRAPSEGRAFQEVVATAAGEHAIALVLADGTREVKSFVAGVPARRMQPERGKGFFSALLWPAEDTFASESPFDEIKFVYPDSDLGWLPGGVGGVLLVFLVASMAFGAAVMKPLGVQI